MNFWDAVFSLPALTIFFFAIALLIAFCFEFINGFHDTANAVTTVIYTRTMKPTPAVVYSGFMNFLGVVFAGTGVAFGIVNLLPVDLLVDRAGSAAALLMVLSGHQRLLRRKPAGVPASARRGLPRARGNRVRT
jgi:inorganic phosphate transporter, PiT family